MDEQATGAATGGVRILLRLEGLTLFVGTVMLYATWDGSWLVFALLFFVPDLSFLAVASGFPQYPFITVAPRMTSWPTMSGPTRLSCSSTIHISVFGMAIPTLVGFRSRSSGGR